MNDSYQDPSSGYSSAGPDMAGSSSGTDDQQHRQASDGGAPVMDNPYAREKMGLTALILAIAAVITFQVFFLSMPLGISAVILALLSRGKGAMVRRARVALCIGASAAFLSAAITGYSVYSVMTDPQLRREFEQLYVYYTGQAFPFSEGSGGSPELPDAAPSQDPQTLIQDILSGNYRKEKNAAGSAETDSGSGAAAGGSIEEILGGAGDDSSQARKGGSYI